MKLPTTTGNLALLTTAQRIEEAYKRGMFKTFTAFFDFVRANMTVWKDEVNEDGSAIRNVRFSDNSSIDIDKKTKQITEVWDI